MLAKMVGTLEFTFLKVSVVDKNIILTYRNGDYGKTKITTLSCAALNGIPETPSDLGSFVEALLRIEATCVKVKRGPEYTTVKAYFDDNYVSCRLSPGVSFAEALEILVRELNENILPTRHKLHKRRR